MQKLLAYCGIPILVLLLSVSTVYGSNYFTLEPVDTSSPRATIMSFLRYSDAYVTAMRTGQPHSHTRDTILQRAIRCFDMSGVAPILLEDVGRESVLLLHEILGRISLPAMDDIPDREEVEKHDLDRWNIPLTGINIKSVTEGSQANTFLFSSETIENLYRYYREVEHLPYNDVLQQGLYENFMYAAGWMIPQVLLDRMPSWLKRGYHGQTVWQWAGLLLLFCIGSLLLWSLFISYRNSKSSKTDPPYSWTLLIFPLLAMAVSFVVEYMARSQLHITGTVLNVTVMVSRGIFLFLASLVIIVGGNIILTAIISSKRLNDKAINADFVRLACRLVSIALVFIMLYFGGMDFGIPVQAVFASAGVAGVALALAARESLANFFGGISILIDGPFQTGDYIVLDSGERGEVKSIGMRSTRLQTRDDILITIPNSVITNVKIVNESAPYPHFRVRVGVGVAYGSDLDLVENILVNVAKDNAMVRKSPEPQALLRTFADSSIHFELLAWAIRPHDRGLLIHDLSKAISRRFNEKGVVIAFPQRDVHLRHVKEE